MDDYKAKAAEIGLRYHVLREKERFERNKRLQEIWTECEMECIVEAGYSLTDALKMAQDYYGIPTY